MKQNSNNRGMLMTHCVAYYPDLKGSLAAARGLYRGGASFLEVQFPFSDPTADGPAIQSACQGALEAGFTVDGGFEFVKTLTKEVTIPVFIMSYGNLPFRRGLERFCGEAAEAGAEGLIIPDLLPPRDEGLHGACKKAGIHAVPVISPGISDERLLEIGAAEPNYIYTTLRGGITGDRTTIGEEQIRHLSRCKKTGAFIFAGFGIETPEQVRSLLSHTDSVVAGSFFVKGIIELMDSEDSEIENGMAEKVSFLLGQGFKKV